MANAKKKQAAAMSTDAQLGTAEKLDQKRAAEAYKKLLSGEQLTEREKVALKRHEKDREEKLRWQYYSSIPQKHWRAMSGRQTKVLNEQATTYGIPFGGPSINLPKLARALHDFLAANARKLASSDDDMLHSGAPSPALERYREERAAMARMERLEREQELVAREEVHQGLVRIASTVRTAGEILERQFGSPAREVLDEALDEADREIEHLFGKEKRGRSKRRKSVKS